MPEIAVHMSTTAEGIKSLRVSIDSDNQTFLGLLEGMSLEKPFDLCDLEEKTETKSNLIDVGLISEESYAELHSGSLKSYDFIVTQLVSLLPTTGLTGTHTFNLTISDGVSEKTGALTVNVN